MFAEESFDVEQEARVRQDTLALSMYSDSSYSSFLKCKKKIQRTKSPFHIVAHRTPFYFKIDFLCFEYFSRFSASYTSYSIDIDNFVTININFTHIFTLSSHSIFISIFLCLLSHRWIIFKPAAPDQFLKEIIALGVI